MKADFLGKRLLFLVAHPDDESLLAAGTIYKNYQKKGESFLICATAGERGKAHLKIKLTNAELKIVRKKELEKVSRICKVKELKVLNFPDTKVSENLKKLENSFLQIAKKIKPEYILSFGPDGITGHLDHIACGKAATNVAKKLKIPILMFCLHPKLKEKGKENMKNRRKFGKYADNIKHLEYKFRVKVDPDIKLKCFRAHRSQQVFKITENKMFAPILGYEYFC